MRIILIAALGENRVIGRDNDLIWHMPADLRHFKRTTTGHHLLMGRKTFESFGGKALPNRTNVIVTHRKEYQPEGVQVVHSLEEGVALARKAGEEELYIGGGETIYEQILPQATHLNLTFIHETFEGDAFFPEWDPQEWREVKREPHQADEKNPYDYTFVLLERK